MFKRQTWKNLFERYREIIVYLIVGLLSSVISYGVRLAIIYGGAALLSIDLGGDLAKASTLRTVAATVGSFAAMTAVFYPNKIWVFRNYEKGRAVLTLFAKYISSRIFSFLLELGFAVVMPLLLGWMNYKPFRFIVEFDADKLTSVLSIIIFTLLNYLFSKVFVFRKKKTDNNTDNNERQEEQ